MKRQLLIVAIIFVYLMVMMPVPSYAQDEEYSLDDFNFDEMRYRDLTRESSFERADWKVIYDQTISKYSWSEAGCKFFDKLHDFGPVGAADPAVAAAAVAASILSAAAENSYVGSHRLVVEESMGERRYAIAERRTIFTPDLAPDGLYHPEGITQWVPLSAGEATMVFFEMGKKPPDALWQQDLSSSLQEFREVSPENWLEFEEWRKKVKPSSSHLPPDDHNGNGDLSGQTGMSNKELWLDFWQTSQIQDDPGGVDFTSIELNYISVHSDSSGGSDFRFLLKGREAQINDKVINPEDAAELSAKSFIIGLAIPNNSFWVNLNPWEPERIINEDVGTTDVGRIMLEADLQMKKDFCNHENPCESEIGEEYWSLLEIKQKQLVQQCMNEYPGQIEDVDNVLFSAATRHWIVPDEITAHGDGDEVCIVDATLDIYSEPVYEHSAFNIVNQSEALISEGCLECLSEITKEYGRYVMELEEEMILPLVVEEVNNGEYYSDLRQVYVSLALAQWYKEHTSDRRVFSDLINSNKLTGLASEAAWNSEDIWREYVESYQEGEYRCEKTHTYHEGSYIITETSIYTGGGVDFADIVDRLSTVDTVNPETSDTINSAINTPFVRIDNDYYLGDCLYTPESVSLPPLGGDEQPAEVSPAPTPTPTPKQGGCGCGGPASRAESSIDGIILVLGIPLVIGIFNYLRRRRRS